MKLLSIKRFYLYISVLLVASCATYKTKYAQEFSGQAIENNKEIDHTFYLIGDAGLSPIGAMNPVLKSFKSRLDSASENSTAIFLGDNIYPAGLPDKENEEYNVAKSHLDAQLNTLTNFSGKPIFIPGNHDWYSDGLKGVKREENYIEEALNNKETFFPENGCPIAEIEISNDIIVIVIDTEWYLTNWDKHPDINDKCEIKDRARFFLAIEDAIRDNSEKTTIIAMHHPMFSYGSHGGQYSFKRHFYPSHGKVPLPFLGTFINVLRRTSGASVEDIENKRYTELKNRLVTLAQYSNKVIFASGHEHTLQYIVEKNIPQIVSGSGAKKGTARLLNGSKFVTGKTGYAILEVYKDGSSKIDFHGIEANKEQLLYSTEVLPPNRKKQKFSGESNFPEFVEASVYTDEDVDKTGFFKKVWGERYRKYYATKVKAPTVNLDTLLGGLKPVRKGGGHQSKSLRLIHKDGRQFVMRALKKSAELYLQSLAFQEEYIIGDFKETTTEALLKDFYTGAHPYAPFVIGGLSDAVGVYHTNPKLYYVPKQAALEDFNKDFGDELYMIEEHVSDGHDLQSFGNIKKIESTNKLMRKLRKDEEYKVDATAYARARLFDMLIGDWDRHVDQWRWAQSKDASGNKIFKPIPRDRDQAFSILGDGAFMGFTTRAIPSLKLFEGFNEEIRSVKGFNSSPMTFALDMVLLSETNIKTWEEQASYIQQHLTTDLIDKAFEKFPEEVRDETVVKIKNTLLARKANLVETARAYFKVINKYSVVTGTDKDDYFSISSLPNGNLNVKAFRIKDGKMGNLFFDKIYDPESTKEVWVYGLDDDDVFDVNKTNGKIKLRLIGGHNNDVYKINENAKRVHVYDFKDKKNTFDEAYGGKVHQVRDYDTNTYQFLKIKASNNQLVPAVGFNPDDGVRLGLSNTYTFNGFRQNPFTQQHTFNAAYYFASSGYDFEYNGEFANTFENVNLELNAKYTSPNFAINFFGFGNETVNNDDDEPLGLDFNRVRIRTIKFAPSLVWRGDLGSKVRLGVSYENYDVEETQGRFIEGFFANTNSDNQQDFFGVDAAYSYANFDNEAFPTIGMEFTLHGGYKTNLSEASRAFGFIIPSISFDYKLVPNGQLVLATKFKGHFNIGNDFEFYQGATIGGNNGLRGFRFQRFNGKTAYFQNTDLRLSFRKKQTGLIPIIPGIFGGFDYGKVWLPNVDSNVWHTSYGGGFFINGSNILSANFGLFNSSDGARFTFGLGFEF